MAHELKRQIAEKTQRLQEWTGSKRTRKRIKKKLGALNKQLAELERGAVDSVADEGDHKLNNETKKGVFMQRTKPNPPTEQAPSTPSAAIGQQSTGIGHQSATVDSDVNAEAVVPSAGDGNVPVYCAVHDTFLPGSA